MKNLKLQIEHDVQEKILHKHNISQRELELSFRNGSPKILSIGDNNYQAITHLFRYVTIIFKYENKTASVITAYVSSEWQIRQYNKK